MSRKDVDAYVASFPLPVRRRLRELRAIVRAVAPETTERISYGVATFDWKGPLVYVAGFKGHVSLYPVPRGNPAFEKALAKLEGGKGTARFPLDRALPAPLVRRIVRFRMAGNREKERLRRGRAPRARSD